MATYLASHPDTPQLALDPPPAPADLSDSSPQRDWLIECRI